MTDHYAEATECMAYASRAGSPEQFDALMRVGELSATLALVDAQREANERARIANIIAFYAAPEVDGLISREEYQTMGKRIREALGL